MKGKSLDSEKSTTAYPTSRRDSFTSRDTSCTMNEVGECVDIDHMAEIELNRPDTPEASKNCHYVSFVFLVYLTIDIQ